MTTITIKGADRAISAGEWLNKQHIEYEIDMMPWASSDPQYHFKFNHKQDAVLFSLKWL